MGRARLLDKKSGKWARSKRFRTSIIEAEERNMAFGIQVSNKRASQHTLDLCILFFTDVPRTFSLMNVF